MKLKKLLIGLGVTAVVVTAWIAFCGYQWCWGPFYRLHDVQTASKPGNDPMYHLDRTESVENSPLQGKTIVFLGSSVTYGSASCGVSFAEFLAVRHDFTAVKEAVPGTTLVDAGSNSYISRMKKLKNENVDLFVCQLSTNDATQKKALGAVSESFDINSFDISTVAGAIEYIIASAQQRWNCPVAFYTNPQYDSEAYGKMVALLWEIQEKWNITVIDFWNDTEFNDLTAEQRALYMSDSIHPTQAGYSLWWMPKMEALLIEAIGA